MEEKKKPKATPNTNNTILGIHYCGKQTYPLCQHLLFLLPLRFLNNIILTYLYLKENNIILTS